jgi:hypothetical protein
MEWCRADQRVIVVAARRHDRLVLESGSEVDVDYFNRRNRVVPGNGHRGSLPVIDNEWANALMPRTKRVTPPPATVIPPIDLKAAPNGCAEASMLSREHYIPCNRPAKFVVAWTGRSDPPVRMCEMCADHNVRNRGGFIAQTFIPDPSAPSIPDEYLAGIIAQAGHNSQVTDADLIAENHKTDDLIKAALAKFNEWKKPHADRVKEIEDELFKRLSERGADSTKTEAGTAYISNLASVKVENPAALFDWIADHWDEYGADISLSIGIKAVRQFMDANNGQLPPGISLSKYSRLNINRS